jgi:hypothetical protein
MMRHESSATTDRYYEGQNTADMAAARGDGQADSL